MTRLARRLLLVMAVATVAIAGWATPVFAHAQLLSTNPAAGTVLPKSPGTVVLHFGEDVEIQFGAVHVYNSASKRVDNGNSYHPNGDGHSVAVKIPSKLAAGGYVVTWRVISADSHPVHGAFTFLIGNGGANAATAATSQATRLLATTSGSVTVGVVFGVDRFLAFAALFVLVGGTAFVVGAWPEGRDDERARWLLVAGLVAAVVTTLAALALQGPYGGGLPLLKALSPTVFREVLKTRFGEVYLVRLVVLLAAAAPLMWRLRRPGALPRWWKPAGIVTGAGILITPGLAGHAATGSLIILAIPFDLVHVSAAAVWVGGLCVLAVAVLVPRKDRDAPNPLRTVLPRYSQWALVAVLAIAISGGFAAWRQIGSLDAVTTTTYGRLVLAKTIVFLILVGIATKSRSIVHGNLALPFRLSRSKGGAVPALAGAGGFSARSTLATPAGGATPDGGATAAATPAAATPAGAGAAKTPAGAAATTMAGATPAGGAAPEATTTTGGAETPAGGAETPAGAATPDGSGAGAATAGAPTGGATPDGGATPAAAAPTAATPAAAGAAKVGPPTDDGTTTVASATPDGTTPAGTAVTAPDGVTPDGTTPDGGALDATAPPGTPPSDHAAGTPTQAASVTLAGNPIPGETGAPSGGASGDEALGAGASAGVAATAVEVAPSNAPPAPAASPDQPRSPGPGAMAPAKPASAKARPTWNARPARPTRRRSGGRRQSDLRKAVGLEVLLVGVILALTAVLVNAQPARQALALPFSTEVHAGTNVLVDVVVDPAKAGPVAIHVYTLSAAGAQLDVASITATMSLPPDISDLTVPLQEGGPGHFLVAGFDVPEKGTWTLNITVQTTKFDEFYATPIKVKMR